MIQKEIPMKNPGKHAANTRRQEMTIADIEAQAKSLTDLAAQFEHVVKEGRGLKGAKIIVDGATKFERHRAGLAQYARNVLSGISMAKIEIVVKKTE